MARRTAPDTRLLYGPYRPPRLKIGDRAPCLYRDCDVVVTGYTDASLSWPRGLPVGGKGHPSILVTKELTRAIARESAAAIRHHWRVSVGVVWRWRKAFGVTRTNNEGTYRRVLAASREGARVTSGVPLAPEQCERRRHPAVEEGFVVRLRYGYERRRWTQEQLALLGTQSDGEVAALTGRSVNAVRLVRTRRGIRMGEGNTDS